MHRRSLCAVAAATALAAIACSKKGKDGKDTPLSAPVATLGGHSITTADFKSRLAELPSFSLPRYKSLDRKKELLDDMVRSDLLLAEARRRGLDNDPEVRATIEKVLIHKLTRVYAEEDQKKNPAPDAELRAYYDRHLSEFVTPTRIRVSHLFIATPEKDAHRARAGAEATKLLQQIKAREAKGEKQALELTASQRSEDPTTKATGGDLGFRTKEELTQAWGAPFSDAILALKAPNEIAPVVTTPKGIHLIKLLGRHEGYETSFDAAKSRIASRLDVERRTHSIDELAADLRKKANVQIDEKALGQIDIEALGKPSGSTNPPVVAGAVGR